MLECVVNVSTADPGVLEQLAAASAPCLLDLHADAHHNRAVLTLAGAGLSEAVERLARLAISRLDLRRHSGVHPRLGVLDVVPFVPVASGPGAPLDEAIAARDRFAHFAACELDLPCFLYGPERSLPEIRRRAFRSLAPDLGPSAAHPSAGACCVGAREALVAFNLVLEEDDLELARNVAIVIRSAEVRALGLQVGEEVQVSCNLVDPFRFGPRDLYELVAPIAGIRRCELVGLVPAAVLEAVPPGMRELLDLGGEPTIEARAAARAVR